MKAKDVKVDAWLRAHQPEVIEDLKTLLRYRTVEDETAVPEEGKPFGPITPHTPSRCPPGSGAKPRASSSCRAASA